MAEAGTVAPTSATVPSSALVRPRKLILVAVGGSRVRRRPGLAALCRSGQAVVLLVTLSACGQSASSTAAQTAAGTSSSPVGSHKPSALAVEVIAGSSGPFDPPLDGPSGPTGFSGDGGPATKAEFSYMVGLAVNSAGDIYLADNGNNRIRRISADGVV